MAIWQQEANRRWKTAWIGGAGQFACAGSFVVRHHVTLFRKSSEAEAHKHRLDALQPEKKRWTSTEVIDLKQLRASGTRTTTLGRR
jgi:hypothetical protein